MTTTAVRQIVSLLDPAGDVLLNMTPAEAAAAGASGDHQRGGRIDGQFAIVQQVGNLVRMAR